MVFNLGLLASMVPMNQLVYWPVPSGISWKTYDWYQTIWSFVRPINMYWSVFETLTLLLLVLKIQPMKICYIIRNLNFMYWICFLINFKFIIRHLVCFLNAWPIGHVSQVVCNNSGHKLLQLAEALLKKHMASHSLHEPDGVDFFSHFHISWHHLWSLFVLIIILNYYA